MSIRRNSVLDEFRSDSSSREGKQQNLNSNTPYYFKSNYGSKHKIDIPFNLCVLIFTFIPGYDMSYMETVLGHDMDDFIWRYE